MAKYLTRTIRAEGGKSSDNSQHDGRYRQQLEQTGIDSSHKVHHLIEPCDAQQS